MRYQALIPSLLVLAAACGPITQKDVDRVRGEVKWAKSELAAAEKSLLPMKAYVKSLEKGALETGYYLLITPGDIKKYGKQAYIPYTFKAKSFHKKLGGTFTTAAIVDVQMLHSNRVKLRLKLKGNKIKVNYKGKAYKPHIKKIKAGLEKGMIVDLLVTLKLDEKKRQVVAKARCLSVKLLAHNEDLYRNNIKSAVNKALSKDKYKIPVPGKGALAPRTLLTTANHVLLLYR